MQFKPKNILVTGGAGFIGCNYVRMMLAKYQDVRIINLDKLTYAGSKDNLNDLADPGRHEFVEGDICDNSLVATLLREFDIDTIVHFAAESHVDRSISGPEAFVQTNVIGTFTLLEAARKYWLEERKLGQDQCRFHHISTDEVYGTLGKEDPAFSETTAYQPNSPYSASKAGSDHLVRAYFHTYGLPVTTTNCSNNYGPYQHQEKLIPTVIRACTNQESIPVYGDGSNIRDWLYVEDHCDAIDVIVRQGELGETYNIGGNNELANIALVKEICSIMDQEVPEHSSHEKLISYVTDRPGHDWRYAIDPTKMQQEFNWQPKIKGNAGLLETIRFYLEER